MAENHGRDARATEEEWARGAKRAESVPTRRLPALLTHRLWGLVLLLLAWGPQEAIRFAVPESLWMDEVYSLVLITRSVPEILTLTTVDAHPPGYYLALKGWMALPDLVGLEPSLAWARLSSFLAWLALVVIVWFGARALAPERPCQGALTAWLVATNAYLLTNVRDLRSYGPAIAAVTACFLILLIQARGGARRPRLLWAAYTVAALTALWCHLLTALLLTLLGLAWIAMAARRWRTNCTFVLGGALAQAAAVLGYLPWLIRVPQQFEYLAVTPVEWQTAPTWLNLRYLFQVWVSWGLVVWEWTPATLALVAGLGALALLVPLLAGSAGWLLRKPSPPTDFLPAVLALLIGGGFMVLLWLLARWNVAKVFHVPRYPVMGAGIFLLGLGLFAGEAARRWGRGGGLALALLVPAFACAGISAWHRHIFDRTQAPSAAFSATIRDLLPPSGEAVYAMPEGVIPQFRALLPEWRLEPASALTALPADRDTATVLLLSTWRQGDTVEERLVKAALDGGHLADSTERRIFPPGNAYVAWRLDGIRHNALPRAFAKPQEAYAPREALTMAPLGDLRLTEGWALLSVDPETLALYRWMNREEAVVRFRAVELPPGRFVVRLRGSRPEYAGAEYPLVVRFPGAVDPSKRFTLPAGKFDVEAEFEFPQSVRHPQATIETPLWLPHEFGDTTTDAYTQAIRLDQAWVEAIP